MRRTGSAIAKSTVSLAVATVILAGSLVFVELGPLSPADRVTVTSTSTASTTSTTTETVEKVVTASAVSSESVSLGNATSSSVSTNGIQLTTSINATGVSSGQGLKVALSISNTLPTVNDVNVSNGWLFRGVPVALWPVCYYSMPAQVAVLEGNYTAGELPLLAGTEFSYQCAEGGSVDHVIFQPSSDQANLTGDMCSLSCDNDTLGPYRLSLNFTTSGYWDVQYLANELNAPIIDEQGGGQLSSFPFVPGVYTVAVEDEWGGVNVLHFQVAAKSHTSSAVLEGFSLCASNCYYPAPFLSGTVYFNSTSPAYYFTLHVNGTSEASFGSYPNPLSNGPFVYKATLGSQVVAGDDYTVAFQFYFFDGTNANATTNVVAR